ncbi:hypothetical protein AB205_0040450 [Aquarana catesbeiana]|uniref:Uncharacterized protein n=1 Tax=Aquarana catesbeiana TaxID=8400 RepID=A0A2G9S3P9_AQUCT|nr:hypothetical protein AB205_0040450 [Aquarana catesbeiana]
MYVWQHTPSFFLHDALPCLPGISIHASLSGSFPFFLHFRSVVSVLLFGGFAWMLLSSLLSLSFSWSLIRFPFHPCILLSHSAVHLHGWVANLISHLHLPLQVCLGGPGLPWMVPCGAAPIGPSTSAPGGVVSPIAERCMASATISRTTIYQDTRLLLTSGTRSHETRRAIIVVFLTSVIPFLIF